MEPDATIRTNKQRAEPHEDREEDLDQDSESPELESFAEPGGDIPEPGQSGAGARFR